MRPDSLSLTDGMFGTKTAVNEQQFSHPSSKSVGRALQFRISNLLSIRYIDILFDLRNLQKFGLSINPRRGTCHS